MSFQGLYPFTRVLDTIGDGTGSVNGAQDFSVTPEVLLVTPPAGAIFHIVRLSIVIADTRVDRWDRYGDIAPGTITNGVAVVAKDGGIEVQINQQIPPTSNTDWLLYGQSVYTPFTTGTNTTVLQYEWLFPTERGVNGLILDGSENEKLEVRLSDDFSGLNRHEFSVTGLADVPL